MKIIYEASDISEAHIVCGMLKANGVEAYVGGHYLQGGLGDLPAMGFAHVHVVDEDVAFAKELIAKYEGTTRVQEKQHKPHRGSLPAKVAYKSTIILFCIGLCAMVLIFLFLF
ncbi:MAG: DUF2007 domain-containing protein [Pseudomonadota bacterium]